MIFIVHFNDGRFYLFVCSDIFWYIHGISKVTLSSSTKKMSMNHLNIFNYVQHSMIRMFAFAYHFYVINLAIIRLKIISKSRHMVICCLLLCNYKWNQAAYVRLPFFPTNSSLWMEAFCWSSLVSVARIPMNAVNSFTHFTITVIKLFLYGANLKYMTDECSWN